MPVRTTRHTIPACIPRLALALSLLFGALPGLCPRAAAQSAAPVSQAPPAADVSPSPAPTPSPSPNAQPSSSVSPLSAGLDSITGVLLPGDKAPPPAHGWVVTGALDLRYRQATSGRTDTLYLNEGEIDVDHPIFWDNTYQGNVYAQVIDENVPDADGGQGPMGDVAVGQAYVSYHLPIQTETGSSAYLQVGQFPLPVGLLPVYDTHDNVLQTLAPLGIGETNDYGFEVFGRFNGIIDYRFASTAGTGADHIELAPDRVLSFRLGRLFATPYGLVDFGGSLLSGRLPVSEVDPQTDLAPIVLPSGRISPLYGYVNKSRLAGDATWVYRALTVRGEAMTGADDQTTVDGYFVMGEYMFSQGLSAIVGRTFWNYGQGNSTSSDNAVGLEFAYRTGVVVRLLYEDQHNSPYSAAPVMDPASANERQVFTIQTLLHF